VLSGGESKTKKFTRNSWAGIIDNAPNISLPSNYLILQKFRSKCEYRGLPYGKYDMWVRAECCRCDVKDMINPFMHDVGV